MFRYPLMLAILTAFLMQLFQAETAEACPMCKLANESASENSNSDTDTATTVPFINNRPKAYMYSILFMIGMPATLFAIFGFLFYRMIRKAQAAQDLTQQDLARTETATREFESFPAPQPSSGS